MTIPKSYEALAADLASEKIISKTLLGQKEAYMMLADKGRLDLSESKAREDALREELSALRESYEAMRDRKNSIVYLQQRLTVAEQLLRRVIACGELTRINHAELEADVCQWLEPVTPAEPVTFGHEYNNLSVEERSAMRVSARIQEVAALKPAEANAPIEDFWEK